MFTDSQIGYTWCLARVFADFARWNVDKQHGESRSVRRLLGRTARHLLREHAGLFPPTAAVRVHAFGSSANGFGDAASDLDLAIEARHRRGVGVVQDVQAMQRPLT